ncbi:RNA-directed DNA polymerase, eukaryota [Tanacetum coccineum]
MAVHAVRGLLVTLLPALQPSHLHLRCTPPPSFTTVGSPHLGFMILERDSASRVGELKIERAEMTRNAQNAENLDIYVLCPVSPTEPKTVTPSFVFEYRINVTVANGEIRFHECLMLKLGYKMITYFFEMNILGGVSSYEVEEVYLLAVSPSLVVWLLKRERERLNMLFNKGETLVMGDFNEVRSESEGLVEIKMEGYSFTWSHPSATKMSKLDRFLVSEDTLSSSIDSWVCDLNGEGVFRVKEIRSILDDLFLPSAVEATRWVKFISIKINVFAWRARLDCLPTRCNLFNRGVIMDSSLCPLCGLVPEDSHHVFFRCNLVKIIFRRICRWWDLHWVDVSFFAD